MGDLDTEECWCTAAGTDTDVGAGVGMNVGVGAGVGMRVGVGVGAGCADGAAVAVGAPSGACVGAEGEACTSAGDMAESETFTVTWAETILAAGAGTTVANETVVAAVAVGAGAASGACRTGEFRFGVCCCDAAADWTCFTGDGFESNCCVGGA